MILVPAVAGCSRQRQFYMSGAVEDGLIIVLPGVEGRGMLNEDICRGLRQGGVKAAVFLYDWTSCWGLLANQRAEATNRERAAELALVIARYQDAWPGRPVLLVGHSGGGAIAIWAAEYLPRGNSIDGVVLLAASLSPHYMLDTALSHSRRGIVSFHSERDWLLLGVGTTVAGTMDGEHTSSAGRVGFVEPQGAARPSVYRRLLQIPWFARMSRTGNTGLHFTSGAGPFVAQYVAPFISIEQWDKALVARVIGQPVRAD